MPNFCSFNLALIAISAFHFVYAFLLMSLVFNWCQYA